MNEAMTVKKTKKIDFARIFLIAILVLVLAAMGYFFLNEKSSKPYEPLSADQIQAVLNRNDSYELDGTRQKIVDEAVSLVGKVNYFWGGKSASDGWDERWGEPVEVFSDGSETTGTIRPFGLDCSGYIAWCYQQAGFTNDQVNNEIGLGTWYQWEYSNPIDKEELIPGDLAFMNKPSSDNHVGIFIGCDTDGDPVFAHCTAKFDNVVVTYEGDVFNYFRRPNVLMD